MKRKRTSNPFSDLQGAALGLAGVGMTAGIGSAMATKAGAPSGIGEGFSTLASFAPVATVGVVGASVLKTVKKKKYKY